MKIPSPLAVAVAALATISPALAGEVPIGAGAFTAVTVGTTDTPILAAGAASIYLEIENDSPTATVCLNFNAAATISTSTCAAGEITIPPLGHWPPYFGAVPQDAIHAIASAASTPVTVGAK